MIALCQLLLLAATAAPPPAAAAAPTPASPAETLRQAKNTFDYGNYTGAAAMADQLLSSRQLDRTADQLEAYRILGLSRFFLHQSLSARDAFLNLLSLDPDYQLDPFYVPPQAIAFFENVRTDNQALLQPIRERRRATQEAQRQEEEARQKLLAQTRPASEEAKVKIVNVRVERHNPALAILPFGIGQFQNGNPKLGWTLAISEAALAGTSIFAYAWYETHRLPDGNFTSVDYNPAIAVRAVQISTGATFFALWAFGIGEALYHFNSTITIKEDDGTATPPPAQSPPPSTPKVSDLKAALAPIPGGAAGTLMFRF